MAQAVFLLAEKAARARGAERFLGGWRLEADRYPVEKGTTLSVGSYYENYWKQGLGHWSPRGQPLPPYEAAFFDAYITQDTKVLDFGCGDGQALGRYVHSRRADYLGADVSNTCVQDCRNAGLNAVVFDPAQDWPWHQAFDVIVAREVLEHLFDPADIAARIRASLRHDGAFVGSVPNVAFIPNRLYLAAGVFNAGGSPTTSTKRPWIDPHIRFFTVKSLRNMLSEAGFRVMVVAGEPFSFRHLPVLYKLEGRSADYLDRISRPIEWLGPALPRLFARRLYFAAR